MIEKVKDNPTDPIGAIVGAIGLILSGFGVWSLLGLTPDQVGMILTGAGALAATVRGIAIARTPGTTETSE